MKYNKSEIMKKAWALFKNAFGTFSECLKRAWQIAKMSDGWKAATKYYEHYFTICQFYDRFEMRCSEWKKYGKDRTYIDAVAIQDGTVVKVYKVGYVDNLTDTFHAVA